MISRSRLAPYRGVFPIAPTPFEEDESLDMEGQTRVLDCMIDQDVDGICILANYSEQFLLNDAERDQLLKICLEHIAGRVPVIVTCSHFSTRISVARAGQAESAGADMIINISASPFHLNKLNERLDIIKVRIDLKRLSELKACVHLMDSQSSNLIDPFVL